jgi:hypothetical protein
MQSFITNGYVKQILFICCCTYKNQNKAYKHYSRNGIYTSIFLVYGALLWIFFFMAFLLRDQPRADDSSLKSKQRKTFLGMVMKDTTSFPLEDNAYLHSSRVSPLECLEEPHGGCISVFLTCVLDNKSRTNIMLPFFILWPIISRLFMFL